MEGTLNIEDVIRNKIIKGKRNLFPITGGLYDKQNKTKNNNNNNNNQVVRGFKTTYITTWLTRTMPNHGGMRIHSDKVSH